LKARLALHGGTIMHTNIVTDISVARSVGYDGIELYLPKLERYLDAGYSTADLRARLGPLRVTMLDALLSIEAREERARSEVAAQCEKFSHLARELDCDVLQAVALADFAAPDWGEQRKALVSSLRGLTEISGRYGVRLALEPVVFSPFHSLSHALELVHEVESEWLGLCLDTWHLWTTETNWDEVVEIDPEIIFAAHLSDTMPRAGSSWTDADRRALPGDGILPLGEGIDAIAATGYDGFWAVEMLSAHHWEWLAEDLAAEVFGRAHSLLADRVRSPPAAQ
jgi:sugar phosphate isomerase/epimerase